jgi:hypothetical protein
MEFAHPDTMLAHQRKHYYWQHKITLNGELLLSLIQYHNQTPNIYIKYILKIGVIQLFLVHGCKVVNLIGHYRQNKVTQGIKISDTAYMQFYAVNNIF